MVVVRPTAGLSPLDAMLLQVESDRTPMTHGLDRVLRSGLPLLDERGDLRIEDLRQLICLPARAGTQAAPDRPTERLDRGAPDVVRRSAFDIANHVTRRRLSAPARTAEFFELCAEVISTPLTPGPALMGAELR